MPLIDALWWNRAHAVPNNNRDAAMANLSAAPSGNNGVLSTTNTFDVNTLMPSSGGGNSTADGNSTSPNAGVASGSRWSTFYPGEVIHIDWSRYNNASAIRDFVDAPDGSSSALGGGLLQSTFRVRGNISEEEEAAAANNRTDSNKVAASFTDLFQQQQQQPGSSFLAPHGEIIHIDWTRNNNITAVRDFKDDDDRDNRGILRSTFAVLGDAQSSATEGDANTYDDDDFGGGGGALTSHLRPTSLVVADVPTSYLSSIKGDANNLCGSRLEGFERCLSSVGGDADRCAEAWERFVTCQQEMQTRSSFY